MKKPLVVFTLGSVEAHYTEVHTTNFSNQLISFITHKLELDFRPYIGKQTMGLRADNSTLIIDNVQKVSYFSYVSFGIWGVCGMATPMKLFWRDKTGRQIVYPDQPFEGEIEFWFENYPTQEDIIRWVENMKDLWEPRKVIKIVREPFPFKVRETRFFQDHYPSVNFTLKSKADSEAVTELLLTTFEAYNEAHEDQGVMHDMYLRKASKDKMLFSIDAGSAPPDAIIVLLKALEKAKFDIESVTIG